MHRGVEPELEALGRDHAGIRSWIASIGSLASQVRIVQDSIDSPCLSQRSRSPPRISQGAWAGLGQNWQAVNDGVMGGVSDGRDIYTKSRRMALWVKAVAP